MSLPLRHHRVIADRHIVPLTVDFLRLVVATAVIYCGIASSLFVRRDVAFVYMLSSLPLVVSLRLASHRTVAIGAFVVAAMTSLGLMYGPWEVVTEYIPIWIVRVVVAVCLTTSAWLLLPIAVTDWALAASSKRGAILWAGFGILVVGVLPLVYVLARCRHDAIVVEELVSQSRFGEARSKIREVCRLAPSMVWRSRSLKELSRELDQRVHALESQVAAMPLAMTTESRLRRCRMLAMLAETEAALAELAKLGESDVAAQAYDLAGTIHENAARWDDARTFHQRALVSWQNQSQSPQRDAGLIQSALRLAYCERKLGNYEVAESHYLEVLAVSPTAENHFLLAQFYEDMQQAGQARTHARQAMSLDPRRYQRDGQKLIDKLTLGHFGCLQIYREESNSSASTTSTGIPQDLASPLIK
ncbi:MAG: putative O-linked N-acetylglucosamine transferase, family [Schlesneria sp.]|nr:putative O-linked N-acetylglucosamine transferase, family [Schlesneria sp.]